MILAIAIIALIGMVFSILTYAGDDKLDCNVFLSAIAVIAWWNISLAVSITLIGVCVLIGIIGSEINK